MGFINSATTINIKGKLTPTGRQRLANGASSLITNFNITFNIQFSVMKVIKL